MILPSIEALLAHAYLNHATKADSNSSSSEYFIDFYCLEGFPQWVVAQYFTVVFTVDTGSPNSDARSTCVPICASTFTKISIFITYPE
jgi:hypothetical protein